MCEKSHAHFWKFDLKKLANKILSPTNVTLIRELIHKNVGILSFFTHCVSLYYKLMVFFCRFDTLLLLYSCFVECKNWSTGKTQKGSKTDQEVYFQHLLYIYISGEWVSIYGGEKRRYVLNQGKMFWISGHGKRLRVYRLKTQRRSWDFRVLGRCWWVAGLTKGWGRWQDP